MVPLQNFNSSKIEHPHPQPEGCVMAGCYAMVKESACYIKTGKFKITCFWHGKEYRVIVGL